MLFLSSCTQEAKTHKDTANSGNELELRALDNLGYGNLEIETDLVSIAEEGKAEDMFEIQKIKIKAESQTAPQITVVNGEVYAAVVLDEKTHLYKFEGEKQIELYIASDIPSLFEHNGCLLFCALESQDPYNYKLMKYDPKTKIFTQLSETKSYKMPIYNSCGDYISVTNSEEKYLYCGDKYEADNEVNFYNFSTGEELVTNKRFEIKKERVVPIKDVKDNYYITYDEIASQLLFYDVDKQKIVSQADLDVRNPNALVCKIFGNRLLMKDTLDIVVYDYANDSYKLIYKREIEELCNCRCFGMICEIIGDVVVFCDSENLYAYDMKNNTVATIGTLQDISYFGTDNETTFAFCGAPVNLIDGEFYTTIYKYEIK